MVMTTGQRPSSLSQFSGIDISGCSMSMEPPAVVAPLNLVGGFKMLIVLFALLLLGTQFSNGCDMDQWVNGCRIYNRQCSCGYGCRSEYRYETMVECTAALRGRRFDFCFKAPCQHGGSCIQITQHPGYKCRCDGTGYYGRDCNNACPDPSLGVPAGRPYPYECIVI